MRRFSRAGLVALALAAAVARGHDAPSSIPSLLESRGGHLLATVELSAAFPPTLQRQLSNGLTNVLALHVTLQPEGGGDPVALYGRTIDVLYDVWEESYAVTVKDPETPRGRRMIFPRFGELKTFLSEARGVDLGPVDELGSERWVVQTRLELNPVSQELLQRTRELIANPGSARGSPSRSVLGAMASYLLRNAETGADVHLFRSPSFTAREVPRR